MTARKSFNSSPPAEDPDRDPMDFKVRARPGSGAEPAAAAGVSADATPATPKILIVEDEGLIANDIADRLQKVGYQVAGIAESGKETLQKIAVLRPDLILMDIRIKGDLDGVETAARVREQFDLPVIFLTAYSDRQTLDRAKVTGPFGYLTKPVQQSSLQTSIEIALYKHRVERELRQQRAWLNTTLRTMGEAVMVTDNTQRIQFLNPAAERLTGWTAAAATDQPMTKVLQIFDPDLGRLSDDVLFGLILEDHPSQLPRGLSSIDRAGRHFAIDGEISPVCRMTNCWAPSLPSAMPASAGRRSNRFAMKTKCRRLAGWPPELLTTSTTCSAASSAKPITRFNTADPIAPAALPWRVSCTPPKPAPPLPASF